jgi:hypothetical protein
MLMALNSSKSAFCHFSELCASNYLFADETRVLASLLVRQAERIASEERSAARRALDLERVVLLCNNKSANVLLPPF